MRRPLRLALWLKAVAAPLEILQRKLFKEIASRMRGAATEGK